MLETLLNRLLNQPVFSCLCQARAAAGNRFSLNEKHALLVFVRTKESALESAVSNLLSANNWREPILDRYKRLPNVFTSDDPALHKAYAAGAEGRGGIVVYEDAIYD